MANWFIQLVEPLIDPNFFFSQLINGLIIGIVYSLVAVGLSLIYGVMKIVNFAHGEFYMLGAYFYYYLVVALGIKPVAMLGILPIMAAVGILVERLLLSPLQRTDFERSNEYPIIITFGLSITLVNLAVLVFSPYTKSPPPFLGGTVPIGPIFVSSDRLLSALVATIAITILYLIINKTKVGMALRATALNKDAASIFGVNTRAIFMISWAAAALLAGLAGALLSPIFLISPSMGSVPSLKSYVILVLGGLGSIKGAFAGSIILGVVESLASAYISDAYRDAYGFAILILILLFRPQGIFGERD
jgi:branched-chain amino acid transport system permease protein